MASLETYLPVSKHSVFRRAFVLFRTLGLRQLIVVDGGNRVCGVLTRKDLMGHALEEKILGPGEVYCNAQPTN